MKRYGRRELDPGNANLPDDTWLYDNPGAWRIVPQKHPRNCTWCGSRLKVKDIRWRLCPSCDELEAMTCA